MLPTPCWPGLDRFGDWLCSALPLGPRGPAVERLGILEVKKPVCHAGKLHFVEVPGVVAARSVVLRGTRLVKVSPSCCILLVLGSLVLYSGISALDLLIPWPRGVYVKAGLWTGLDSGLDWTLDWTMDCNMD